MLESEHLRLRAAGPEDAPAIHALWCDPGLHLIANSGPFVPETVEAVRRRFEKYQEVGPAATEVRMVVENRNNAGFVGIGVIWGIDQFQQYAHLGLALTADSRGRGYGTELLQLLCRYGFWLRNLRRLELETLGSNIGMRRTAERCGFTHDGTQRQREYDGSGFVDVVLYGLLRSEWEQQPSSSAG
jgi:RimJ/RimL family protein N-acetyltransferase